VLRDRRYFSLTPADFRKFVALLDKPPKDISGLRRLLLTAAPWDRCRFKFWMIGLTLRGRTNGKLSF